VTTTSEPLFAVLRYSATLKKLAAAHGMTVDV
jgi:hypothetical protein